MREVNQYIFLILLINNNSCRTGLSLTTWRSLCWWACSNGNTRSLACTWFIASRTWIDTIIVKQIVISQTSYACKTSSCSWWTCSTWSSTGCTCSWNISIACITRSLAFTSLKNSSTNTTSTSRCGPNTSVTEDCWITRKTFFCWSFNLNCCVRAWGKTDRVA